ncbi:MAG: hypothetical protein ACJ71D_08200 [Nitrososphaera sp.]
MSLATTVMILTVMALMIIPATMLFSTAVPEAFGERIVLDSRQSVRTNVTTNDDIVKDNNAADRNISSLMITQSPQNGLDVECEGGLNCEILDNNTVVATTTTATPGQNTSSSSTTAMITSNLNALNQSLTQSLNQSNIPPSLLPFGNNNNNNNDFDMLLDDQDLDSSIDGFIDRILNETLGNMQTPLQTPPDLRSVSV